MARQTPGLSVWQRNYYEHVIRDEEELGQVREYIVTNPAKWEQDAQSPLVVSRSSEIVWQVYISRRGGSETRPRHGSQRPAHLSSSERS